MFSSSLKAGRTAEMEWNDIADRGAEPKLQRVTGELRIEN
jgi:hypothetical protein